MKSVSKAPLGVLEIESKKSVKEKKYPFFKGFKPLFKEKGFWPVIFLIKFL